MARADLDKWEAKHAIESSAEPSVTFAWLPAAQAGDVALDLACGQGRNTLKLLELGYRVVAADISARALVRLAAKASGTGSQYLPVQCDLDDWPFSRNSFDLIVQCDFLDRSLFPSIKECVKPSGIVLIDTFAAAPPSAELRRGPSNPEYRLRRGELEDVFSGWSTLARTDAGDSQSKLAILVKRPKLL